MMSANTYPILQSGFVGLTQQGLRRPDIVEPSLRQSVIFKEYKLPLARYFFSPEVTELFVAWSSNPNSLKDFDFRERIIKAALASFGNPSIYRWITMQDEKPTVSDLHKAYILETMEYLFADKPRSIQNVQWIRLLEASEKSHRVHVDVEKYFSRSALGPATEFRLPSALRDIIRAWVTKEQGFEDLLITLFVIFGDRGSRTDISNSTS